MKSNKFQSRFYRQWPETKGLISFQVQVSESDLYIRASSNLSVQAKESLINYRSQIESYIKENHSFLTTLEPYPIDPLMPKIVRNMTIAAQKAGVGPMAAVAGAVAESIGQDLLKYSSELIIENGGDIFLASQSIRKIGLYAGPKIPHIFIEIHPNQKSCGICTSSGTLGHSLSFGKADSVTIIADTAALADAAATKVGNIIQSENDIDSGMEAGLSIDGVKGLIITVNGKIAIKGDIILNE